MSDIEIKEHSFVKYASELTEICEPLFANTPVNFFEPCRIYKNNDYAGFMTDGVWAEHFLKQKYQESGIGKYAAETLTSDFTLWTVSGMWEINARSRAMGEDCVAFNYGNGATLIERHEEYTQLYYFAAGSGATFINQFFIENLEQLAQFVLYFKEQLGKNKALMQAYQTRYGAAEVEIEVPFSTQKIMPPPVNAHYISDNVALSKRELECAQLLCLGNKTKIIAHKLNLSPRTVEDYLAGLKNKLQCDSLQELIIKLLHMF